MTPVETLLAKADGEGLRDAVLDVINYMILVYALLTEDE